MSDDREGRSGPVSGAHTSSPAGEIGQAPPGSGAPSDGQLVPGGDLGIEDLLPLAIPVSARRGAGRPAGSRNIRTNKTFQIAVSRYGDPLIASIAWGNMDTKQLIRELRIIASECGLKLGATVMDVVRFQEECRRNAAPYGHAKRAPTDEKGETVMPIIALGRFDVPAPSLGGRSMEEIIDVTPDDGKSAPDQSVSSGETAKSHGLKSHEKGSD